MRYVKVIDERTIEDAPSSAVIGGRIVIGTLPADWLEANGWLPLDETPEPQETPGIGKHWEPRYAEAEGRVAQTWAQAANPPRSFSKRRLYRAFSEAGVWAAVKSYMEGSGVWEDWAYATTLDEDDPLIAAALPAIQAALGWTAEQVESVLAASVAEA